MRATATLVFAGWLLAACLSESGGGRLDAIRRRGFLTCGVWPVVAGFAQRDADGRYSGLDVDMCRVVAAAVFGSPDSVRFIESETVQGFVEAGDVDIVSRRLTWELQREARLGLLFGPIMFYDGQTFLVPRRLGITSVRQLSGRPVCFRPVSHSEVTYELYFRTQGFQVSKVPLPSVDSLADAFATGRCAAYTEDASMLASIRSRLPRPGDFVILPNLISKEPLAQLVRKGDGGFFDVVRWSILAAIHAEELGITSANVGEMLESRDLETRRFLGVLPGNGAALGLDERWAFNIIRTMGNYGEMFERNVGAGSPIGLERGLNRLWTGGGLLYAPPLR